MILNPLAIPERRFHPGACAVCLSTRRLHPCTNCYLVSYCSELHEALDAEYHQLFCKICSLFGNHHDTKSPRRFTVNGTNRIPVRTVQITKEGKKENNNEDVNGDLKNKSTLNLIRSSTDEVIPSASYQTVFYEVNWNAAKYLSSPNELLKWKDQIMFEISCLLRRSLDSFETQCILFPKLCSICLNDNPYELLSCPNCHSVFFCKLHQSFLQQHQEEIVPYLKFQSHDEIKITQKNDPMENSESSSEIKKEIVKGHHQNPKTVIDGNLNDKDTNSLCLLLRQALECDRKEQLLGIENVDEILISFFNQSSTSSNQLLHKCQNLYHWLQLFFNQKREDTQLHYNLEQLENHDTKTCIKDLKFGHVQVVTKISKLLLSDPISFPLTLLDSLNMIRNDINGISTERLIIHVVGAETHRELLGLSRWEILLHELENVNHIELIFIGSALECDLDEGKIEGEELDKIQFKKDQNTSNAEENDHNLPAPSSILFYQREFGSWNKDRCYLTIDGKQLLCRHCSKKSICYRIFPYMSYFEFAKYWTQEESSNILPPWIQEGPNLVVAYNCGFHVAVDDVEVWDLESLTSLLQNGFKRKSESGVHHAPLLFTSLTLSECQEDLKYLQDSLNHFSINVIQSPILNNYSSLRPIRDATGGNSGARPTIYVANGAKCIVQKGAD